MSASWSFFELLLIFLIGLIVLGPERLPKVANEIGTWIGKARRMTRVMKRQLEDELDVEKHLGLPPSMTQTPRDDDDYSPMHDDEEPKIGGVGAASTAATTASTTAGDKSISPGSAATTEGDTGKPREQQDG